MATEKNNEVKSKTKKTSTKKTTAAKKEAVAKQVEKKVKPVEKKVFNAGDLIKVVNVFPGTVAFEGTKTKSVYVLEGIDDESYIEYQDLRPMCLSRRNSFIWDPQIIVCDDDFLTEFPALNDLYDEMLRPDDIKKILISKNGKRIRGMLNKATEYSRDIIKTITATLIKDGELDSIKIVNIVDEYLETELYKQLLNN